MTTDMNMDMNSHQSTFSIQVWKEQGDEKLQWQECNLKFGSKVKVADSERDNYWIWENVLKSGEMFWLFRPSLDQDLYVTFDDSGEVTMKSKSVKSWVYIGTSCDRVVDKSKMKGYFQVYVAYDGYIIQAPETQDYLAVKEGVLVLSDVPTVWSLKLQYAKETKPYAKIISLEKDKTLMWVCTRPLEGAWISVQKSTPRTNQALWYITSVPKVSEGYHFQPKLNENLFVTNDVPTNSVTLERRTPTKSIIRREIQSSSAEAVNLLDVNRTRYIYVEPVENTLALTTSNKDAAKVIAWRPRLYTFGRNGLSTPPDLKPRCEIGASEEAAFQPPNIE